MINGRPYIVRRVPLRRRTRRMPEDIAFLGLMIFALALVTAFEFALFPDHIPMRRTIVRLLSGAPPESWNLVE